MKIYAIINKRHLSIEGNSTLSRYPVSGDISKARRKFASREAARAYKRALSTKHNWAIVDTRYNEVVR